MAVKLSIIVKHSSFDNPFESRNRHR